MSEWSPIIQAEIRRVRSAHSVEEFAQSVQQAALNLLQFSDNLGERLEKTISGVTDPIVRTVLTCLAGRVEAGQTLLLLATSPAIYAEAAVASALQEVMEGSDDDEDDDDDESDESDATAEMGVAANLEEGFKQLLQKK